MIIIDKFLGLFPKEWEENIRMIKRDFWRINFIKTLYFNFTAFNLKNAVKIPVLVGYNVKLYEIGRIDFLESIKPGMLSLGVKRFEGIDDSSQKLMFRNRGIIEIGNRIKIHPGARLLIGSKGLLKIMGKNTIGCHSRVVCHKGITIGINSGCSWECQLMDTDFHFVIDLEAQKPLKRRAPIYIGNDVFIGNHCNVSKGSKIPNGSILSSWSNVSGSFIKKGENLLISGNPAKVIDYNFTMTHAWDSDKEELFSKQLGE